MRGAVALCVFALGGVLAPAAESAPRDVGVRSFDGVNIATTFIPTPRPGADGRAPTIMVTHGWGGTRIRTAGGGSEGLGVASLGALSAAGYNLLSWDSRGFGESGGTVSVDGPDFEGRDVQALIDFLATQPEQELDGPGDPRVGMHGASYAGGIELVAAGLDRRIDAIAPAIAWNSLVSSLNKAGAVKGGWGSVLVGSGSVSAPLLGLFAPTGPETGGLDSRIMSAFAAALATGRFPANELEWFRSRGPGELVERIRAPTLLIQGTVDTLFTPNEAVINHAILKRNRVPVQMLWFCGGHGICNAGKTPDGLVTSRVIAWMDRWLRRDTRVDTGPAFEWTGHDGGTRSADDYPLAPAAAGPVTGSGAGRLAITPADTASSGEVLIAATPGRGSVVRIPLPAPAGGTEIVGAPRLSFQYTGTGAPRAAHVFAQVVDKRRNVVVGAQVTPVAVVLDGKPRQATLELEEIATRMGPEDRFEVQLVPGTGVYLPQRASGTLSVTRASAALPTVDAAATRPRFPPNRARPGAGAAGRKKCRARRGVRLRVERLRGRRIRTVVIRVPGHKPIRRRVARRDETLRRRYVRVSLRGVRGKRVRIRIAARTVGGKRVRVIRTVRLRRCARR